MQGFHPKQGTYSIIAPFHGTSTTKLASYSGKLIIFEENIGGCNGKDRSCIYSPAVFRSVTSKS